jgi:hypothetical protein
MLRVWGVNISSTIMYAPLIMKLHRVDVLYRTLQTGGRRKIITGYLLLGCPVLSVFFYYLYINSLTYAFGWSAFLCRIRFCDTLVVIFFHHHHHYHYHYHHLRHYHHHYRFSCWVSSSCIALGWYIDSRFVYCIGTTTTNYRKYLCMINTQNWVRIVYDIYKFCRCHFVFIMKFSRNIQMAVLIRYISQKILQ